MKEVLTNVRAWQAVAGAAVAQAVIAWVNPPRDVLGYLAFCLVVNAVVLLVVGFVAVRGRDSVR